MNLVLKIRSFYNDFSKNMNQRVQLIIIGVLVGLFSGLASVSLNMGLHFFSGFLKNLTDSPLLNIMIPALGILVSVLLLKFVFRDIETEGVPDVIYAVSLKGGALKLRSSFSKLIANLITISSGGSAGPEAPVILSGASIGSNIAQYLGANKRIKIAAAGSGAAGAIAAIFNAPVAGVIFTMEIILGEWSTLNLLPVAISSVTATVVSRLFRGNQIPFKHQLINVGINDIVGSIGLAFMISCVALLFIQILRYAHSFFASYMKNIYIRALVGGLCVGTGIYFFDSIRGEGYELVRQLMDGEFKSGLAVLMLLIFLKIAATSVTLGAGGTGGVFAPSLVIGGLTGYFYYELLVYLFPDTLFSGPSLFVFCGMAGILSGTIQAPLTGIFLIFEITGGYDVILPLLLVSFLCLAIVKFFEKYSIYQSSLREKGLLIRPRTDEGVLKELGVQELLEKDLITVKPDMLLSELIPVIQKSSRNYFPVEDAKTGKFTGMVYFNSIKEYLFNPVLANSIIVNEVMDKNPRTVDYREDLVKILKDFDTYNVWSLPVLKNGRFAGLISKSSVLDHYRKELKTQTDY